MFVSGGIFLNDLVELMKLIVKIITFITMIILIMQLKTMRKSNKLSVEMKIFTEYINGKWNGIKRRLYEKENEIVDYNEFKDVKEYIDFLAIIGFLLKNKYLTNTVCYETIGNNVINTWEKVSKYIDDVRTRNNVKERNEFYLWGIEYLTYEMKKYEKRYKKKMYKLIEKMDK